MHQKRKLPFYMLAGLGLTVAVSGCAGNQGGGTASTAGKQETNKPEERIKLKLFMSDSGVPVPNGTDPSNNEFINVVENLANVDLDVEIPSYADFTTKYNLMLSSGNIPDIVHGTDTKVTDLRGDEGAFLDLKKYYDKSDKIKKVITPEMMELAKSDSGHYYRIPMNMTNQPQGRGVVVRYDLLVKYNEGKWPQTIEEWVEMMRKLKKAEPESVPLSNRLEGERAFGGGGKTVFFWHGAMPFEYRVQNGKVVSTFQLPEYKAAIELMKQLYDEGLLDKEFATNDNTRYASKKSTKNTMFEMTSSDQLVPSAAAKPKNAEFIEWQWSPALTKYPSVLKDPKYALPYKGSPIGESGLYISKQSKDPDRAWRVIEAFASNELSEAIFWGKEGVTYEVKDGKRVPIPEALRKQYWAINLALVWGFNGRVESNIAAAAQFLSKEELSRKLDGMKMLQEQAIQKGASLETFVTLTPEAVKKKSEADAFISKASVEAIMGKISMAEFDKKVEEFTKKFGFIYDEYTDYMKKNKDKLEKFGVKEVNW
ncbi:extracellular solute-binding protein [Paenibacillus sp. MBLB4367]|uniref:extracellular solute-binding protein n=1 Tax=Paenibacillus sp. MBLB4367 TaxID=3384767 RepID=UPI0039083E8F